MLGYTLFENNTVGDDSTYIATSTTWIAQSFTPGTVHNLWTLAIKCLDVSSCGNVTIKIYNVGSNGKPTGTALATMTVTGVTATASWCYTALTSSIRATSQLIAVVYCVGQLGVRYQSVGTYSAGKAWVSTDSGSTWAELSGVSFLFQDWGQSLPIYGTYRIPLYPTGAGTYTQLYNQNSSSTPNYSRVNDPIDAVDDSPLNAVCYALGPMGHAGFKLNIGSDSFLSGLSDGAAGRFTGTKILWKNGVAGMWGTGTDFLSEVVSGYITRSPSKNEWYKGSHFRNSEIETVNTGTTITLEDTPGDGLPEDLPKAWYYTPNTTALADGGDTKTGYMDLNAPNTLPMTFMPGIWDFVTGSDVVTATGGSALSLFPDPDFIYNFISTGPNTAKDHGVFYPCQHVDSDNQVTLWDNFSLGGGSGIHRTGLNGASKYSYFGFEDDLTSDDTATQWCSNEKMDSYAIKTTLNEGNIYRMYIRYRVYLFHTNRVTGTSYTATAKPFVYLNGVFSYGTEETITADETEAVYWTGDHWNFPTVHEFEVVVSKPGGGVFTKDDLPDLEVGIVLGNLSNVNDPIAEFCSQINLIAEVSRLPVNALSTSRVGIDDVGFLVFGDNWSEFNQYVGGDGIDTMGWGVHYIFNLFTTWVSRPFKKVRAAGIRLVRPISRVFVIRRR